MILTKVNNGSWNNCMQTSSMLSVENVHQSAVCMITVKWRQLVNSSRLSDAFVHVQLGHHWSRLWSVACSTPSHYLNKNCLIVNTWRPRQHGRHFADDTFKRNSMKGNFGISIKISLNFVHKGPINTFPALIQIMAWRRPGDKSLSEPMVVRLPTDICVTRPQWVNWSRGKIFQRIFYQNNAHTRKLG